MKNVAQGDEYRKFAIFNATMRRDPYAVILIIQKEERALNRAFDLCHEKYDRYTKLADRLFLCVPQQLGHAIQNDKNRLFDTVSAQLQKIIAKKLALNKLEVFDLTLPQQQAYICELQALTASCKKTQMKIDTFEKDLRVSAKIILPTNTPPAIEPPTTTAPPTMRRP